MAKKRAVRNVRVPPQRARPLGVHIIALVFYVSALFGALIGLALIIGGPIFFNSETGQSSIQAIASQLGISQTVVTATSLSALFIGFGIVALLMATVEFLIGRGLWKCKQWARIITIILMILGVINAIGEIAQGRPVGGIIDLVISAGIASYLSFSKQVQSAFS